jgi:alanyl-tRNA synthetase
MALVCDGAEVDVADAGPVQVAVNQTPFYAESGGQVGDQGTLETDTGRLRVLDTKRSAGVTIHEAEVVEGRVERGQAARLAVDHARRSAIRANHSATHLLNEALRSALGEHVAQRGSLNAPDRLRFDFTHGQALTAEELGRVEAEVNALIRQNGEVVTRLMTPDDARALGAQALFGEKYGDEVRVVSMGRHPGSGKGEGGDTYSIELCGGTHVGRTGDIGAFVALGDSASSSGVRRIEALTGQAALDHLRQQDQRLAAVAAALRTPAAEVPERVRALMDERRALQNEVAQLRRQVAMGGPAAAPVAREVGGVAFRSQVLRGVTGRDLPTLIDGIKAEMGTGVVLLIAEDGGRAAVAAGVTPDLAARVSAVDVLRAAVAELGGKGGGGRPDLAQGGAASAENAEAAIRAAEAVIEGVPA